MSKDSLIDWCEENFNKEKDLEFQRDKEDSKIINLSIYKKRASNNCNFSRTPITKMEKRCRRKPR